MHVFGLKGIADARRYMAEKGQAAELDSEDWPALIRAARCG